VSADRGRPAPRVVILQDAISDYRKPFFNALAEHFEVHVVHAGRATVGPSDRYRECVVPARPLGPFRLQPLGPILRSLAPLAAVIVIFDLRWPSALAAAWRAHGARRLLWGHRYSHRAVVNRLRDMLMRRCDGVIQYGDEETAEMLRRGLPRERIFIAPNTIAVANHEDCSGQPKHSFLFVGRLQPRKRLDELVQAFADVCPELPPHTRLELVGDGDILGELQALAERRGIAQRVLFHPATTDAALLKTLFARALAYVSPDSVGLGVLHAFAYGVPVVTGNPRGSQQTGFRHGPEFGNLRDGENALLFSDHAGLCRQLLALATQPALAARLGHAAYLHYAGQRRIEHMVDGFRRAIAGTTVRPTSG
jgi:glycosyltransferase involved in cell wall biosynthesis